MNQNGLSYKINFYQKPGRLRDLIIYVIDPSEYSRTNPNGIFSLTRTGNCAMNQTHYGLTYPYLISCLGVNAVRLCKSVIPLLTALGLPGLASALTYPADVPLGGEVQQSVVSGQCYVARGSSEFQRNGAANKAVITVPEMVGAGYQLNGQMILSFGTPSSGSVRFGYATAYPANIQLVKFSGYGQSYNSANNTLVAHFTINFPGCTLPVLATYTFP
jgi:hypothetical protein